MFPDRRPKEATLTLAQRSNLWPVTAAMYDAWRVRSLGLLTGGPYPLGRELALMVDWLGVEPGAPYLDVGTSTGNYARALAKAGALVTAIDLSPAMLARARALTLSPRVRYELANAEAMPYPDGSFAGVAVGATVNEFASTRTGLLECARVLRPGGRLFLMYLRRADTAGGRRLQGAFEAGGVSFPDWRAVRSVLGEGGLARRRATGRRAVALELYEKAAGRGL